MIAHFSLQVASQRYFDCIDKEGAWYERPRTAPALRPEDVKQAYACGLDAESILQLICEINHRFLNEVRQRFPNDDERCRRMSIIEEGPEQRVRMAHLAINGTDMVGEHYMHITTNSSAAARQYNEYTSG